MVPHRFPFVFTFPQDSIAYIASSWGDSAEATAGITENTTQERVGIEVIVSLIEGGLTLLEY